MLNNIFYFVFYGSAVLLYGVGLNRSMLLAEKPKNLFLKFVKILFSVILSVTLLYLISVHLLVPANLEELVPFFIIVVFTSISVFIESLIRITAKTRTSEYAISFFCILIGLTESSSLLETILNSSLSILSFFILIPVLYSIRNRVVVSDKKVTNIFFVFISIAIIMITMLFWNVCWLNQGVLR